MAGSGWRKPYMQCRRWLGCSDDEKQSIQANTILCCESLTYSTHHKLSKENSAVLRYFITIVCWAVLIFVGVTPVYDTYAADLASDKISKWVMDKTQSGISVEMIVILQPQADLRGTSHLLSRREKGRFVYNALVEKARESQRPIVRLLKQRGMEHRTYHIVNAIWVKADRETALMLASRSDVARIEGNPSVRGIPEEIRVEPAVPNFDTGVEGSLSYVHAPQVWALGYTGQGIVVGGQDTGYQWDHPALKAQYRGWSGGAVDHDYNWHDAIHSNTNGANICGANAIAPCDDHGHGTHTMGTITGDDGGANQIGMAPGARWIGCRNMDNGFGTPQSYLECFEFFQAPYPLGGDPLTQGNPELSPDVINNSWECTSYEGCTDVTVLRSAVQALFAAGIMTVASAGNNGNYRCSTIASPPAIYAESYSVGALNTGNDTLASFSSVGPVTIDGSGRRKPDITAPGTSIRSSVRGGGYGVMSGTSMASPHVTGAVALLWSAVPALKNNLTATMGRLNTSAFHLSSTACGSTGWPNNTFGYGRLDALEMLNIVKGDINGDGRVDLADAIICLQVVSGLATDNINSTVDVDGDWKIGMAEAIYAIQKVAGLR
jgi:serine protease AprX